MTKFKEKKNTGSIIKCGGEVRIRASTYLGFGYFRVTKPCFDGRKWKPSPLEWKQLKMESENRYIFENF